MKNFKNNNNSTLANASVFGLAQLVNNGMVATINKPAFSSADLWNIQRTVRTAFARRRNLFN